MMSMQLGDLGFFYHSSVKPPGIAGICKVSRTAYPDFTALDPASDYYDPKASPEKPIWQMVDVEYVRTFHALITLDELRAMPELDGMPLLRRGQRLSVQPVTAAQWRAILRVADAQTA
jgi:predicted RNA-binding protein with PUA-like domain